MADNLLSVADLGVNLGDRWLLRHADVTVSAGDRLCLVGRNGAGKSTLMKMMAGLSEADEGSLWVAPGVTVSYLPQAPILPRGMSLASIVQHGTGSDGDYVAETHRAEAMITRMGLDPGWLSDGLSGGEARRVALARALVKEPDVLLMDEPTNHLDLPTITWMEEMLLARSGAMVIISHDRAFLRRIGNGTLWIEHGVLRRRQGAFDGFYDWAEAIQAEEATRLYKMDRRIAAETRWSREGISARRKRNMGRMRELETLRMERARLAAPLGRNARMETTAVESGGQMVLEAIDLTVTVPASRPGQKPEAMAGDADRRVLLNHFNGLVRKGDRIGIIGPNGIGKSTLVKALLGLINPDSGRVREGFGLMTSYFDQQRASLNGEDTPWSVLCPGGGDTVEIGGRSVHVKRYLQDFLFDEYKVTQRVRTLSGGEQNRLLLARLFAEDHNFLVLDEPTNDLDMETLELLQEVIADYTGTVLIISHDRDFIDRTVTALLVFEDEGRIIPHAGGYSDYLSRRTRNEERKRTKPAKSPPKEKRIANRTARLSFKDKHALETLPGEIAGLETSIAAAESKLADPDLFARNAELFNLLAEQVRQERTLLARLEDRWLELELLRQEIDGD
ncbi:ABC-F family ATP-binding cassette domain-containing protein [Alphaproteobacteria bacterium LSUCC0684]